VIEMGKDKTPEIIALNEVLLMMQESLCPDTYEKFIESYNELIKTRSLGLKRVCLGTTTLNERR
jgi:hypothetical protein